MNFQRIKIGISKSAFMLLWIKDLHFRQKYIGVGSKKEAQLGAITLGNAKSSINQTSNYFAFLFLNNKVIKFNRRRLLSMKGRANKSNFLQKDGSTNIEMGIS